MINISLVVGRRYPQDDVDRFLRSVPPGLEVIIADGLGGLKVDRPNIHVIPLPGRTLAELRGAALSLATGEAVAIVDPDCRLAPGWLAAAQRAIETAPVASGPVAYAGGRSRSTWAAFLAEYGAFLPPSSAAAGVAGTNLIVRRALLGQPTNFWKDEAVARLRAAGHTPLYVPDLLVFHRRPWHALGFLLDRFQQGRCYAGRRSASPLERFARVLVAPLTGLVLFARLARSFRPRRHRRLAFVMAAPLLLTFLMSWSIGEAIGYLHGPGESCRRC